MNIHRFGLSLTIVATAASFLSVLRTDAQGPTRPLASVAEDCVAMAFSNDGRIAYASRHIKGGKKYDIERDDIGIATVEGKKKHVIDGMKFVKTTNPYSFSVRRISWSPDSQKLAVEMDTVESLDPKTQSQEQEAVELLNDDGREITIPHSETGKIPDAFQPAWDRYDENVFYLAPVVKPATLFNIESMQVADGQKHDVFVGHTFVAIAWNLAQEMAVGIERDKNLGGLQLVQLDLSKQTIAPLAMLENYLGNLTISPTGSKVGYFIDGETLEVRNLASPNRPTRVRAVAGTYYWGPDEQRVLLKSGPTNESAEVIWVRISNGDFQPIMHDLTFRNLAISPNGQYLALTTPGERALNIYPLPE